MEKTPICIFSAFGSLKNKRVWAEKIGKKWKNSKILKVAGNYPDSYTQLFKWGHSRNGSWVDKGGS